MENQSSMGDQFLDKIFRLVEDNLQNEDFSVEDLAQKAGLSRSMLHRRLIKLTGKSASDIITEKRLSRAKELLENNVATSSEIAYKVGFSSPSYFNKVFKGYYHVSPGDVRKGAATIMSPRPVHLHKKIWEKHAGFVILIILLIAISVGTGIYYTIRKDKPLERSIAILPFDDISSDKRSQYFADGIVEDLLNRVSKIKGLKVISRTSSEMFREKGSKSIPEIAELLQVSYILEGTVQREADQIRINIQLIDAKNDAHIMSQQYNRDLTEIFKIQSEIAGQIASELSLVLTAKELTALKNVQTENLKALEYKQLGRYHLNKRTQEDLLTSIKYFRQAIKEDPNYALAYAELADAYFIQSWYLYIDRQTGRDSAVYFALKALKLDRNLGEAHTVLGVIYNEYDWKYKEAEEEFIKAIELNQSHATAYQYYSEFLCAAGKLQDARKILNKAVDLDPYSYIIRYASSLLYYKQEDFIQALEENKICQALSKENWGAADLEFLINLKLKDEQSALSSFKKLVNISDNLTPKEVDSVYRIGGIDGLLRWRLDNGIWDNERHKARYYVFLGENSKALDILENSLNKGLLEPFNITNPDFRILYSNPRFKVIMKKMGLPHQ